MQILMHHGYTCDINYHNFTSPKGYWTSPGMSMHNMNDTILFNDYCPPNYCVKEMQDFILNSSLVNTSCVGNRSGVLCGQCRDGYSVVFGSDRCYSHCTYLYLLTLPAYVLAGVILVFALFWLRLTVASGIINGVIFYANILGLVMNQMTGDYSGHSLTIALDIINFIISILNLNLGSPLCFYKGMTPAAKVGFQFIFPVYLWCIVVGLIVISKYSTKVSKLIATSSVQVLSTLFYLSFSKLLHTVITIFSSTSITAVIYNDVGYSNQSEKLIWYYNGMDYGHDVHGFLIFLAVIFTLPFLLPYAILSTFSFFFMRFGVVNKFRPFVDAYGGPFKAKWRFWFGFRLWLTIILFCVNGALEGTNTGKMFLFYIVAVLIFILLQAFTRPFKNTFIGLIDIFFMLNFLIIIEVYYLFNSIFDAIYVFLTVFAILVLCLIILYQGCQSKIQKHCGHFIQQVRRRIQMLTFTKLLRIEWSDTY